MISAWCGVLPAKWDQHSDAEDVVVVLGQFARAVGADKILAAHAHPAACVAVEELPGLLRIQHAIGRTLGLRNPV